MVNFPTFIDATLEHIHTLITPERKLKAHLNINSLRNKIEPVKEIFNNNIDINWMNLFRQKCSQWRAFACFEKTEIKLVVG